MFMLSYGVPLISNNLNLPRPVFENKRLKSQPFPRSFYFCEYKLDPILFPSIPLLHHNPFIIDLPKYTSSLPSDILHHAAE